MAVAESLNGDRGNVCEWCDLWMIQLNASKTKIMIVLYIAPGGMLLGLSPARSGGILFINAKLAT